MGKNSSAFFILLGFWLLVLSDSKKVFTLPEDFPITIKSEQGYIVPGIHKEFLPQPIFYESYIPLVLEFQTPTWNKSDITFNNWYTCISETFPFRYSCPVAFHMNSAILNLHVDFEGLHPAVDVSGNSNADEASQLFYQRQATSTDFCSKIQRHFPGPYASAKDVDNYLEVLKNCRIETDAPSFVQRNISDFNYSIRIPFTKMENNFYSSFYRALVSPEYNSATTNNSSSTTTPISSGSSSPLSNFNPKMDIVASALLSNARTTLQSGILAFYYAEKARWVSATSDCLRGFIPQSIVTRQRLLDSLVSIENDTGFSSTHELSISSKLASRYYSLPLTDCVHTSDGKLLVRIQIPIVRKNRSKALQLVHTHIIPFEYRGHVCRVKLGEHVTGGFFQDSRPHGSHYLYEELSGQAFPTDCKGNELCAISEYGLTQKSNADRCGSALMTRNFSVIRNHCGFNCRKQDLTETPIITRLDSNQFVLTGSPIDLNVNCERNFGLDHHASQQSRRIKESSIGAHLIRLSPNCFISFPKGGKLKNLNFWGEGGQGQAYGGYSLIEVLPMIPVQFCKAKEDGDSSVFVYENLTPETKVNLADFIDLERADGYLNGGWKGLGKIENSDADELVSAELECGSSLTALWIVFVLTSLLILGTQAYIFYLIKKNEKISYAKDERILYKIPDSPVMY